LHPNKLPNKSVNGCDLQLIFCHYNSQFAGFDPKEDQSLLVEKPVNHFPWQSPVHDSLSHSASKCIVVCFFERGFPPFESANATIWQVLQHFMFNHIGPCQLMGSEIDFCGPIHEFVIRI
jgi:hypothetical protein